MKRKDHEKKISSRTLERLSVYLRYLTFLQIEGKDRVDSRELAELALVTPALLRKDLSQFGDFGRSGYGYSITHLKDSLETILGIDRNRSVIIIGAGNIGRALAEYEYFGKLNFTLCGVFDNDTEKIGSKIGAVKVRDVATLEGFLEKNEVSIAIIATPCEAVRIVYSRLIACGINAIWNFAPIDLAGTEHTYVINEHLSKNLLVLSYFLSRDKGK